MASNTHRYFALGTKVTVLGKRESTLDFCDPEIFEFTCEGDLVQEPRVVRADLDGRLDRSEPVHQGYSWEPHVPVIDRVHDHPF